MCESHEDMGADEGGETMIRTDIIEIIFNKKLGLETKNRKYD